MATESYEVSGHNIKLSTANEVGYCEACGGTIYDYEVVTCECGRLIHGSCSLKCKHCERPGCKFCLIKDEETLERFCDTGSDGILENSECFQENNNG